MNNFSKMILDNIGKVFIGKENEILDIIKGILAEGHILKVHLGYPRTEDELKILQGKNMGISLDDLNAVVSREEVIEMQNRVKDIHISYEIQKYIIRIVQATRNSEKVILGVSTRGAIALMRIAQAEALLDNRDYVIPEDVKKNAKIVLSHRIIKQNIKDSEEKIIEDIISTIPVVI